MSGLAFNTMNEPDLLLAAINPHTYMSDRDIKRLLAELKHRHDVGGNYSKAIRRVERSIAKAGRK